MDSKQNIRLRLLSYAVIAYMLLAFTWWSVLLYEKNRDAFYAKRELLLIGMVAEGRVSGQAAFQQTPEFQELQSKYRAQKYMIMGEAAVFVASLLVGMYLINRGYHKEIQSARQRRNFLLSITHELKSPIASIQLVLETMKRRTTLKPELKERLMENALSDTDRLHGLVNDLLLSAKLETAYQPFQEHIDLSELVDGIIDKMRHKYPKIKFVYAQDGNIPMVYGDKTGLTSVALNLLENAVKYSTPPIRIETNLHFQTDDIVLEVADNGIGIEDKEKKYIFDKFYRVGNEDTRKTKGTGLGLYIVAEIVRAHKGTITVQDNHPQGTLFRITLPARATTGQQEQKSLKAS